MDSLDDRTGASAAGTGSVAIIAPSDEFELSHRVLDDGSIEIGYTLPRDSTDVFLGLWNQFAFWIRTLVEVPTADAGRHTVVWDGNEQDGEPAGTGLFICRMSVGNNQGASHMVQLTA